MNMDAIAKVDCLNDTRTVHVNIDAQGYLVAARFDGPDGGERRRHHHPDLAL